jgi:hypothetical protein
MRAMAIYRIGIAAVSQHSTILAAISNLPIMHPILKNIAAGIAGLIVGSIVNMALIMVSGSIVPPPEGADLTTAEGLQLGMAMMEPRHFIFPFLAHALGTLAGAYLAARIAARRKMGMALVIGIFFLAGGSASV